ncbi:MAG: apolipoprotein N-acyltransferase [Chlamydiota bacterium]|jgi:apolipoprotein N-acyltransferase
MIKLFGLFLVSLLIVAFGQPAWIPILGYLSSCVGFALFWLFLEKMPRKAGKWFFATLWFCLVQSVQLSWMTATKYQGNYILLVYLFVIVAMGVQFGLLSLMLFLKKKPSVLHCLAIASLWVLMEWSRVFFISGFTWNPVGLSYTNNTASLQIASLFGVYGLSFWVIFTNTMVLRSWKLNKNYFAVSLIITLPYFYGVCHKMVLEKTLKPKQMTVALVQTSIMPEQKQSYSSAFSPIYQWHRIMLFLKNEIKKDTHLVVLPEAALPYGSSRCVYPVEKVKDIFSDVFGVKSFNFFPKLNQPLARKAANNDWYVSNSFIAQALANYYSCEVVVGLDDLDPLTGDFFNAGFCFQKGKSSEKYFKRVLVPLGEYIPFEWCTSLAEKFGVYDSFQAGTEAKVMSTKIPLAISICYEETYSEIVRQSRKLGAELFVNISNDVWFPDSKLPWQHFFHGRVRAVENGVPLLRCCNTGITGGIDCFGKIVKILGSKDGSSEKIAGALSLDLPLKSYRTLYSSVGDGSIIGTSCLILLIFLRLHNKNRAC